MFLIMLIMLILVPKSSVRLKNHFISAVSFILINAFIKLVFFVISFREMDIWSKEIKFGALCDVFEAVSKHPDKTKKMVMLKDFLARCR